MAGDGTDGYFLRITRFYRRVGRASSGSQSTGHRSLHQAGNITDPKRYTRAIFGARDGDWCYAFHRGFSGLTEQREASRGNFWSCRELMYRFALTMSPDRMEAIAAYAYFEMFKSGLTRVGEFHYLHHAQDGQTYDNPCEMSAHIFSAADTSGIAQGGDADLVALTDPMDLGDGKDQTLDRWIFGRDIYVSEVWASGRLVVSDGRHINRDRIEAGMKRVFQALLDQ